MFFIEIDFSLFELLVKLPTLSQHALAQDRLMIQWFQIFNWLLFDFACYSFFLLVQFLKSFNSKSN